MPPLSSPVVWRRGACLSGLGFFFDAARSQSLCFVSSAWAVEGRLNRCGVVLFTEATAALCSAVQGPVLCPQLVSPPGRPFTWGKLRLELFPNGDMPGSAALWIRLPDGHRVVYAGTPSEEPMPNGQPLSVRPADTLVLSASCAAQHSHIPSDDEILGALFEEQKRAREQGVPLCVRVSSPNRLARLKQQLGDAPVRLHRRLRVLFEKVCGVRPPVSLSYTPLAGEIVLCPLWELPTWAFRGARVWTFPDGLAQDDLVQFATACGAQKVLLLSGFSEQVADALGRLGVSCEALAPPFQLPLFAPPSEQPPRTSSM